MMGEMNGFSGEEGMINLYDFCKAIGRRKKFILTLMLVGVISAGAVSLLMPKIYRGEASLRVNLKDVVSPSINKEVIDIIGNTEKEKMQRIFPGNYSRISEVKISEIKGSNDKIRVTIETSDPTKIGDELREFVMYVNNIPDIKYLIDLRREKLKKQIDEVALAIEKSETLITTLEKMMKEGKLLPVGFNPIELNKKATDLKVEKLDYEQGLANLAGIKMMENPFISKEAVKPRIILNMILAGLVCFLIGMFIVVLKEYVDKIKDSRRIR